MSPGWVGVLDLAAGLLLLGGALLSVVAAVGLLRFPDVLTRMHSAAKPQVLGLVLVVLGVALRLRDPGVLGMLALVILFQLVTAPIASHMVGRAAVRGRRAVRTDLLTVDEVTGRLDDEEPRGAP